MTHHTPHSARETLLSNTVLSTEQVEQDDVLYVGVFGGLNIVTAGNAECAEDDSEHGLTDTECVVGERGLRRKLEGTLHAGQRCQGQDKTETVTRGRQKWTLSKARYLIPETTIRTCFVKAMTVFSYATSETNKNVGSLISTVRILQSRAMSFRVLRGGPWPVPKQYAALFEEASGQYPSSTQHCTRRPRPVPSSRQHYTRRPPASTLQ